VKLNVYDMVSMANFNQYSSPVGFGVFHSGAEVYGCEYAYGGHNNSHSGVFEIAPRDVVALGEDSFRFRETIVIGYTDFDPEDVKQIVEQFGEKFRGDKYHLLHQNCNHFTDALTRVNYHRWLLNIPWVIFRNFDDHHILTVFSLTQNEILILLGALWTRYSYLGE
jgi:hypothetical protein